MPFGKIVTKHLSMLSLLNELNIFAKTPYPVLITGETGTGKELLAEAVHKASCRTGKYLRVNVGGVDDTFFSDILFGHVKGAFTGAYKTSKGLVCQAEGGTLFLDEIGELNDASQIKLLRLIQQGEYFPVGSHSMKVARCRIVMATNRGIDQLSDINVFRPDLFHRLKPYQLHIPPLRNRKDDIPYLFDHFLALTANEQFKDIPEYTSDIQTVLQSYHYPGNIRELEGMIKRVLLTHSEGCLSVKPFEDFISQHDGMRKESETSETSETREASEITSDWVSGLIALPTLKEGATILVHEAMKRAEGNQSLAADMLGITRSALSQRLSKIREQDLQNN